MAVEKAACLAGDPELRGACTDRAAPPVLEPGVLTERGTGNRRVGVAPSGRFAGQPSHDPQHPRAQRADRPAARGRRTVGGDLRAVGNGPPDGVDDGHVGRRPMVMRSRPAAARAPGHKRSDRHARREESSMPHSDQTPAGPHRFPVRKRRPPADPLHSSQAAGVALRGRPFQPAAAGTR